MMFPTGWARRILPVSAALIVGAVLAIACTVAPPPPPPTTTTTSTSTTAPTGPPTVTERQITPSTTDPAIGLPNDPHFVKVTDAAHANGKLLLFFPPSTAKPACCDMFMKQAAQLGYHVIGLTYPNSTTIFSRCNSDVACYGRVRQNLFDGSQPSPEGQVSPTDSVQHRLDALLGHLVVHYPAEGWSAFYTGGGVDWSKVVVAGHSQGAGQAPYVAAIRSVSGVIMFSGVADTTMTAPFTPATWVTSGHLTPIDRYYGLVHTSDPGYAKIRSAWTGLGLDALGAAVDISTGPPYANRHELLTTISVPAGLLPAHSMTAVDLYTPLCPNGTPVLEPAWRYLLLAAGTFPYTSAPAPC